VNLWISKLIRIPNVFALGFNSKQTLTLTLSFYLSELEIILGKIPSSNLETFQFPFFKKTVTHEGIELTTFTFKVWPPNIEPPWVMNVKVSKLFSIPNLFALGFNREKTQTLAFHLFELELILGQTPSSNTQTF